jgi:hypothetical protein
VSTLKVVSSEIVPFYFILSPGRRQHISVCNQTVPMKLLYFVHVGNFIMVLYKSCRRCFPCCLYLPNQTTTKVRLSTRQTTTNRERLSIILASFCGQPKQFVKKSQESAHLIIENPTISFLYGALDSSLAAARRQETVTSWAAAGHSPKEPEPTAGALAGGKP